MDRHVAALLAMTGMGSLDFITQRLRVRPSSRNDMKRGHQSFHTVCPAQGYTKAMYPVANYLLT